MYTGDAAVCSDLLSEFYAADYPLRHTHTTTPQLRLIFAPGLDSQTGWRELQGLLAGYPLGYGPQSRYLPDHVPTSPIASLRTLLVPLLTPLALSTHSTDPPLPRDNRSQEGRDEALAPRDVV